MCFISVPNLIEIETWEDYFYATYIYLNKNTKGAKKCKANQKQQLSTKKFDITQRPRSLEHNDIMLTRG